MLRFDGLFGVKSLSEPMRDQCEIEPLGTNVCEIVMKTHQISHNLNKCENAIYKMAGILFQLHCVKSD